MDWPLSSVTTLFYEWVCILLVASIELLLYVPSLPFQHSSHLEISWLDLYHFFSTFLLLTELGSLFFWFMRLVFVECVLWRLLLMFYFLFLSIFQPPVSNDGFNINHFLHSYQFELSSLLRLSPGMPTGSRVQCKVTEHCRCNQHQNEDDEKPESSGSGSQLPNWLWIDGISCLGLSFFYCRIRREMVLSPLSWGLTVILGWL